jgi:hypothetical protein
MEEVKTHSILWFVKSLQIVGMVSMLIGTAFLVKLGVDYFDRWLSGAIWLWGILHFITILGSSFMILNGLFFMVLAWVLHWLLNIQKFL